jgi:uncharacterized membrane protein
VLNQICEKHCKRSRKQLVVFITLWCVSLATISVYLRRKGEAPTVPRRFYTVVCVLTSDVWCLRVTLSATTARATLVHDMYVGFPRDTGVACAYRTFCHK